MAQEPLRSLFPFCFCLDHEWITIFNGPVDTQVWRLYCDSYCKVCGSLRIHFTIGIQFNMSLHPSSEQEQILYQNSKNFYSTQLLLRERTQQIQHALHSGAGPPMGNFRAGLVSGLHQLFGAVLTSLLVFYLFRR